MSECRYLHRHKGMHTHTHVLEYIEACTSTHMHTYARAYT